jgi:tetratricopeptide (TPR) repeat protein
MLNFRRRFLWGVAGLLTLLVLSYFGKRGASGVARRQVSPAPVPAVLSAPPAGMRAAYHTSYRLRPDRRFLLAVEEVARLFGRDTSPSRASAEFLDGRWRIRLGNTEVGNLPELPDFPDFLTALKAWAKTASRDTRAAGGGPAPSTSAPNRWDTLGDLDRQWKEQPSAAILRSAAAQLSWLALESLDKLEIADVIPARALAALAMAEAMGGESAPREECLLAEAMDYTVHATAACTALPDDDPLRLFVNREPAALLEQAGPGSNAETKYLALLGLAELGQAEPWTAAYQRLYPRTSLSLPLLKAGLRVGDFVLNRDLSNTLLAELPAGIGYLPGRFTKLVALVTAMAGRSRLAKDFEAALSARSRSFDGAFVDPALYAAYHRAYFYSGLYIRGLHDLDNLSSIPDAGLFSKFVDASAAGLEGDFARWFTHLVNSKRGQRQIAPLVQDLSELGSLGGAALGRTFQEVRRNVPYVDPLPDAVRRWVASLDTRPAHRLLLAEASIFSLSDLPRGTRLYDSVVATSPFLSPDHMVWHAWFTGNARLLDLLSSMPQFQRGIAAHLEREARKAGGAVAEWPEPLTRWLKDQPDNWSVRQHYVRYLEEKREYAAARQVAQDWLAGHDASRGLEYVSAMTAVARICYRQGRYQEGQAYAAKVAPSQQGSAMLWYGRLLTMNGDPGRAEKVFRAAAERYPDNLPALGSLAWFYWQRGRFDEAAAVLRGSPFTQQARAWSDDLARRFADAFARRPLERALAAFAALLRAGLNGEPMTELARHMERAGSPETAFRMEEQVRAGNPLGDMEATIHAYRFLKAARGKPAALNWLGKRVPADARDTAVLVAYDQGENDLVWELIPEPAGKQADYIWQLRAAACVKTGCKDPWRGMLIRHYRQPSGPQPAVGPYLVGLVDEATFLSQAKDPGQRSLAAYYVGLRAEAEGRWEEASDWFRVAVEAGRIGVYEWRWASFALGRWVQDGRSLARQRATGGYR